MADKKGKRVKTSCVLEILLVIPHFIKTTYDISLEKALLNEDLDAKSDSDRQFPDKLSINAGWKGCVGLGLNKK